MTEKYIETQNDLQHIAEKLDQLKTKFSSKMDTWSIKHFDNAINQAFKIKECIGKLDE